MAPAFSDRLWYEPKVWLISLLIQHNYWLRLILSSCFSDRTGGCWFPFSSDKNDWCTLAGVIDVFDQERGHRHDHPWVSIQGEQLKKVPCWAGKWTASSLRKHLLLLIKIDWEKKKVISVQGWPSSVKLIKQCSLHCFFYSSQEKILDGERSSVT